MKKLSKIALALALPLVFMSCDDTAVDAQALDEATIKALNEAIQDEYKAQLFYQKTLDKFGQVLPFANIVKAEVKHQESLATLFANYGLTVPHSQWKDEEITAFATIQESCANCYQAEIDNVALYDNYLKQSLPDDVKRVFENNRAASLDKHLPAFSMCK